MSGAPVSPDRLRSLRERVTAATTPAERVEAALSLADQIWLSDPVTARPLLEQVVAEAEAAGRIKDKGRAAYVLGELMRRAGDLDGQERRVAPKRSSESLSQPPTVAFARTG